MGTDLYLPQLTKLEPEQAERVAAGVNALISDLGDRPDNVDGTVEDWWTYVPFQELGGATIAQAWLDGNVEGVRSLFELLYARTRASIQRVADDPEFRAFLLDRIAELP